jgi:ABC transporter, ATP-binding protein
MITLSADNLVKAYKGRKVVDRVSLEVNKGEIVGLLGPNGAGKTTTFYMITGIVRPDDGEVLCGEEDITNLPMYKRADMGIGYLAQEPSVFRNLTVEENIEVVLEMKGISKKEQRETVHRLLEEFKLTHVRDSLGYALSGGERRRIEIARTIANNPSFILLDEPFAGVDPIAVEDIQNIIRHLKKRGLGILITDHNVRETLSITDRSYVMQKGKVLIEGTPYEIANDPLAKKVYLGEKFRLD